MKIIKPDEIKEIIIHDNNTIRIYFKDGKELDIDMINEWISLQEEDETAKRQNLIGKVLGQIRKDVFCGDDLSAIEILIEDIPEEKLKAFLE